MTSPFPPSYTQTANSLVERILELAKTKPEVEEMREPWGLLKLGLDTSDLEPTLAQAQWALDRAQTILRDR